MSHINSNVPVIAITPDEGPNIENDNYNIDEVATDVENIYFQTEKRKKKTRKHAPKKDLYATDVEDMDGSDDDISSPLIKHANPISIDQVIIQADIPAVEENVKTSDSNSRVKPKLRSQASVTSKTKYLQPDEVELKQALTDVEDFNDSNDDDEVSEPEPSDTDLLKEIIYDSGTIAISDSVKKFLQAVPSPMVTPVDISDEDVGNKRKSTKKGGKNKSNKQYMDPKSLCTNLNELTDVETLQCDSNDETKHKPKHVKGRRHTLSRKIKLDTTDSEDLDVSENEQVKNRRVTVAGIPKIGLNQFSFDNPDDELNHSFITIPQIVNEGDSDTEGIPMFKNLKITKRSNQLLQIEERENGGTTDIEDMDGDSEIEEDNTNNENKDDGFELDLDSNCGVVEEKCSTKKNNMYKVEGSFVREEKNKNWNSTENETDEEDQCDSEISKAELCSPCIENVDLKFVTRNPKGKPKKSYIKQSNKNTLGLPTVENEVLTDVENLNSSDDDDDLNEIPVTVVKGLLSNCLTDSESVDGEIEYKTFEDDDIPDNLPSCSRKLICVKVNENNVSEIVSSTLPENEDENTDTINLSNETDLEEISGEEELYEYVDDKFVIELDVTDENNTDYKDTLKLPRKIQSDEDETDIEDISEVKPKTRKSSHRFLHVAQEEADKYTDVEDLDLSDTENTGKKYNLQVIGNTGADKTDVEDFYASDNDNDRVLPEYSRTPDILRQMGGETICSQEGSGSFTQQDRNRLNEKHNITNVTGTSPSPTYTDEFITSADDDYYSRAETATPLQMRQELDEASSFRVHNQTTKKIDLDAEDEVMYLKGGGFLQEGHTDTEELGVSEEEYYLANDKNEDKIRDNQQQMSISVELQNEGMCFLGLQSLIYIDNKIESRVKMYSLDTATSKKIQKPFLLFSLNTSKSNASYKTDISLNKLILDATKYITLFYINCFKTVEFKHLMCSTLNFDISEFCIKSIRSQSLIHGQLTSSFGTANSGKFPYFLRFRSGSVTKLITHYEHNNEMKKIDNEIVIPELNKYMNEKEKTKRKKSVKLHIELKRNIVLEKTKHFEMLLKNKEANVKEVKRIFKSKGKLLMSISKRIMVMVHTAYIHI